LNSSGAPWINKVAPKIRKRPDTAWLPETAEPQTIRRTWAEAPVVDPNDGSDMNYTANFGPEGVQAPKSSTLENLAPVSCR
jgi:hypothetical protein